MQTDRMDVYPVRPMTQLELEALAKQFTREGFDVVHELAQLQRIMADPIFLKYSIRSNELTFIQFMNLRRVLWIMESQR